ncbi:MAG: alpha/beta fold hydrolase, partial [Pseudomonadota bacterium]
KPKNSFIRWAVAQGFTVFVISWVNPGADLADKTFEDYMFEGPMAAMNAIREATSEPELNIIGYCLGGTLTACLLAYLAAQGDDRVQAATFFTTMTDFEEPGELAVFIDDPQLDKLEDHMRHTGYLEAKHMQSVFSMMRANDLIWSFVIHNYLLGREPLAFDLLYWNNDSTRMPAMMHSFYLRKMYQQNLLTQPGAVSLGGVPIDLKQIKIPAYFLSTREDHIAPWKSTYRGSRLLGGDVRFVLGGSGHIAGVINPPAANKYGYWVGEHQADDAETWLQRATYHEGSWWTDWSAWAAPHSGDQIPTRVPCEGKLPALEAAPGSYVMTRANVSS